MNPSFSPFWLSLQSYLHQNPRNLEIVASLLETHFSQFLNSPAFSSLTSAELHAVYLIAASVWTRAFDSPRHLSLLPAFVQAVITDARHRFLPLSIHELGVFHTVLEFLLAVIRFTPSPIPVGAAHAILTYYHSVWQRGDLRRYQISPTAFTASHWGAITDPLYNKLHYCYQSACLDVGKNHGISALPEQVTTYLLTSIHQQTDRQFAMVFGALSNSWYRLIPQVIELHLDHLLHGPRLWTHAVVYGYAFQAGFTDQILQVALRNNFGPLLIRQSQTLPLALRAILGSSLILQIFSANSMFTPVQWHAICVSMITEVTWIRDFLPVLADYATDYGHHLSFARIKALFHFLDQIYPT